MHANRRHVTRFSGRGRKPERTAHRAGTNLSKQYLSVIIREKVHQFLATIGMKDRSKNTVRRKLWK